ncbi:hypothetical protein TNCV_164401 [Trichonephila clavipes]|nr:hypothetical protein TNCV_164401 [Trichonephila clavipes]
MGALLIIHVGAPVAWGLLIFDTADTAVATPLVGGEVKRETCQFRVPTSSFHYGPKLRGCIQRLHDTYVVSVIITEKYHGSLTLSSSVVRGVEFRKEMTRIKIRSSARKERAIPSTGPPATFQSFVAAVEFDKWRNEKRYTLFQITVQVRWRVFDRSSVPANISASLEK